MNMALVNLCFVNVCLMLLQVGFAAAGREEGSEDVSEVFMWNPS